MSAHSTKKERAWLLPDSQNQKLSPGLYLVATPIGNLADVTLRALDVLAGCDMIVCEDTRVSKKLLSHYGIQKPLMSYNDHATQGRREKIIKTLIEGGVVALISDAGMPLVSDPGYKLVRACVEARLNVTSVPGANAPLSALQLSGFPSDRFCFLGFLPAKEQARRNALSEWKNVAVTLIAFEGVSRLLAMLMDVEEVLGACRVSVVREITKKFEEVRSGDIADVIAHYQESGPPKGEIVVVISPGQGEEWDEVAVRRKLGVALQTMKTKEACDFVHGITGLPKKTLYDLVLDMKSDDSKR